MSIAGRNCGSEILFLGLASGVAIGAGGSASAAEVYFALQPEYSGVDTTDGNGHDTGTNYTLQRPASITKMSPSGAFTNVITLNDPQNYTETFAGHTFSAPVPSFQKRFLSADAGGNVYALQGDYNTRVLSGLLKIAPGGQTLNTNLPAEVSNAVGAALSPSGRFSYSLQPIYSGVDVNNGDQTNYTLSQASVLRTLNSNGSTTSVHALNDPSSYTYDWNTNAASAAVPTFGTFLSADAAGNIYALPYDLENGNAPVSLLKVTPNGQTSTIAVPGEANHSAGIAMDPRGNFYYSTRAEYTYEEIDNAQGNEIGANHTLIRPSTLYKVAPNGSITTVHTLNDPQFYSENFQNGTASAFVPTFGTFLTADGAGNTYTLPYDLANSSSNNFNLLKVDPTGHTFNTPVPALYNFSAAIALGPDYEQAPLSSDQTAGLLGGAAGDHPGGVSINFGHAVSGIVEAGYTTTGLANLQTLNGTVNFALPSEDGLIQLWNLSSDAPLTGPAEVVFHYDASLLLPGVQPSDLRIYHFDGSAWVQLAGTVDSLAQTITVTTPSFSPFALGTVPEPTTAAGLAAILTLSGFGRRRRNGRFEKE